MIAAKLRRVACTLATLTRYSAMTALERRIWLFPAQKREYGLLKCPPESGHSLHAASITWN
jgi:hypothetical protein